MATSHYREDFVLKGGVLLAAFSLRRPTKDIDLQASGIADDVQAVLQRVREIAIVQVSDGLIFDPSVIAAHTIREDGNYAGVRVRAVATLGRARIPVGIDVNFGDPIWPAPSAVTIPRLVEIGQRPVRILGYPLPMVVAEKTVTAIDRGEANTRWRDFADIHAISAVHEVMATELRASLETVATYRGVILRPLLPALASMPATAQAKWSRWRRRQAHAESLPEEFSDVLAAVSAFVDPVLGSTALDSARWDPAERRWRHA